MSKTAYRSNTCGELTEKDIDKKVKLCGWVATRRDHGGVIFIDLRDRYGITQIVFDPSYNKEPHELSDNLRREFCIQIDGIVKRRKKGMDNSNLATGKIEVFADKLTILSTADVPPIEITDRKEVNEDMRLKYRYLDLRKDSMQYDIQQRHKIVKAVRDYFDKLNFLDIETPMLAKSTPEGARDYLVPSRIHPGNFYALPQSPQLFKQLLMLSGFDRYMQIARCFRDEDLRADRQPEFTQIDIEMSFIDEEDIYNVMEGLMKHLWKEIYNKELKTPFPRLNYEESMKKYGCDNPDTRFELFLHDVTDLAKKSNFEIFKKTEVVKCINPEKEFTRKEIEDLTAFCQELGAKGLAWIRLNNGKLEGSIVKYFSSEIQKELIKKLNAKKGYIFFIADAKQQCNQIISKLRLRLGNELKLIDEKKQNFLWIVDFPLLEWNQEDNRWQAMHHPFTSPKESDLELLEKQPDKVRAKAYDLVLNGNEIAGGSIRIHKREIQERMFKALNISKKEAEQKFGFLLEAFKYGAPPHGGIAFGLDRLIMLMTNADSIREVIAFPKNKFARDLMTDAPSEVSDKQLKELHLKLDLVKK